MSLVGIETGLPKLGWKDVVRYDSIQDPRLGLRAGTFGGKMPDGHLEYAVEVRGVRRADE